MGGRIKWCWLVEVGLGGGKGRGRGRWWTGGIRGNGQDGCLGEWATTQDSADKRVLLLASDVLCSLAWKC